MKYTITVTHVVEADDLQQAFNRLVKYYSSTQYTIEQDMRRSMNEPYEVEIKDVMSTSKPLCIMFLCEKDRLVLRPDENEYMFRPHSKCSRCRAAMNIPQEEEL